MCPLCDIENAELHIGDHKPLVLGDCDSKDTRVNVVDKYGSTAYVTYCFKGDSERTDDTSFV